MISVSEAQKLIATHSNIFETITVPLYEATGLVSAENMFSTINFPPFDQSAMDGYGFRMEDLDENKSLTITDEIPAGVFPTKPLLVNSAVRIFTGAPVPLGCNTIVIQEKVTVIDNKLFINDDQITIGANIRTQGFQTKIGDLVLEAKTKITPGVIGYLAGLGFDQIKVFRKPNICVITTGNELNKPGNTLENGKVYECNSYSLHAALSEYKIEPKKVISVIDNEAEITQVIKQNIPHFDIIILSGGVSVGDYDFVSKALENCGVQKIFHKVKQKPGKPLYFGKINNTIIFGLPGNPSALLSCFYLFISPVIKKMMGLKIENKTLLPLSNSFTKKAGLTFFLKGKMLENKVTILQAQESFLMSSFAYANCIVQLDEDKTEFNKGDLVEVFLLN
ncbi:MAG: gephyrin-like molybdotransferase Glp [Bacteroidia bacterium]